MKYLIVGLGNIGPEYAMTRHNAGFRVADALVESASASFSTERYGDIARMRVKNAQLVVLKPSTYMNLSGNAVRYWKEKEGIEVENILVFVDARHNGLKNIAQMLGTQAYPRLRFGIGNDFPRGTQIDYVLGRFTDDEEKAIGERIEVAVEAVKTFCLAGIQTAMCNYNNK